MANPIRTCAHCAEQLPDSATKRRRYCGSRCYDKARRARDPERRKTIERRTSKKRLADPVRAERLRLAAQSRARAAYCAGPTTRTCVICSVQYCNVFGKLSWMNTCSDACTRAKGLRKRIRNEKVRRLRKRGIDCEMVDPFKVFERDGWKCQLCGVATPKRLRGSHKDRAPELDHILPLAAGGAHTYANTQCSCRKCNRIKWVTPAGQLQLFTEPSNG